MQGKYWCFTNNNPSDDPDPADFPNLSLMVYQHEIGEENGVHHLQGYIEFTMNKRLNTVRRMFLWDDPHLEVRIGTRAQAVTYCTKLDTREVALAEPFYWPDKASCEAVLLPGARNDIHGFVIAIQRGASNGDLVNSHPVVFVKYHRSAEAVRLAMPPPAQIERPLDSIMYWGPSTTGKTHLLKHEYPEGDEWFWCSPGKWMSGYQGQPGLVFNEIRDSWFRWEFLLRLIDNAPRRNESKGGTLRMTAYKFRFSSNVHPKKWYKGMKSKPNSPWLGSPLRSRFSQIILMNQRVAAEHLVQLIDDDEPSTSEDVEQYQPNLVYPFN